VVAEQWNGIAWTVDTTPPPPGVQTTLSAISCSTTTTCIAVGTEIPSSYGNAPIAEELTAGIWTVQSIPDPTGGGYLNGVSCSDATDCTAVGQDGNFSSTLAERWSGGAWSIESTPATPFLALSGVSCAAAASCEAVGDTATQMLVEGWSGAAWTVQTPAATVSAEYSSLTGVSCTASDACSAVGWAYNPGTIPNTFGERWNGTRWTLQPIPEPAGAESAVVAGVSCGGPTSCVAVGNDELSPAAPYYGETTAELWNGATWSVLSTPNPTWSGVNTASLTAVSCANATTCTAVGSSAGFAVGGASQVPLAERWEDGAWVIQSTPDPAGTLTSTLYGVSCAGTGTCEAVGNLDADNVLQSQAMSWNGTTWALQTVPVPAGDLESVLKAVSCSAANACTAVGSYIDAAGTQLPLIERWNGSTWTIERVPRKSTPSLDGVSCASATTCVAVMSQSSTHMAQRWDGSTWRLESTRTPAGSLGPSLASVSCSLDGACMAVGFNVGTAALNITFTERSP
jgi:hypothetical protein